MPATSFPTPSPPLRARLLLRLGRLLARASSPVLARGLGHCAGLLGAPADERRAWTLRGEVLWAARRPAVRLCRRLAFEGWEAMHEAEAGAAPRVLVGLPGARFELALLILGTYGLSVRRLVLTHEDTYLEPELRAVGHQFLAAPDGLRSAEGLGVALLGTEGGAESLADPKAVALPLFVYAAAREFRLVLWHNTKLPQKTASKNDQPLEWLHRVVGMAAEDERSRLPESWRWRARS